MKKVNIKAFYDFKSQVANLRITKLTKKDIDQLIKQANSIINSK